MAFSATAQQLSYSDPAISYQRICWKKAGGLFNRSVIFKVTGTSFLYGGNQREYLYAKRRQNLPR